MNSGNEIVRTHSNRDRHAARSLIVDSANLRRTNESLESHHDGCCAALLDWWKCSNVITKVRILAFVILPCLAIGLYIFHYPQHRGLLHNPLAVLHPLSIVHPLIPTPFQSTVKFIDEQAKNILGKSLDVPVTTKKGPIIGRRVDPNPATGASYDVFLGIPYGRIPARFQNAVPASSWTAPMKAQTDGAACPQPGVEFSEDCLFINVFTPKDAADSLLSYPVLVFIHDSGFTWGSGSSQHYGPDFLVPKDIILVTFNYRLGAIGFLTLGSPEAPGNMGLYDTRLALRWVRDEIGGFGGDPARVTVMGQGAGSVLAMYHYLAPASNGLFRAVIAQSGSALAEWGQYSGAEGAARARALAAAVGCNETSVDTRMLSCLTAANITELVDMQEMELDTRFEASGQTMVFLPVLDTDFADQPFFTDTLNNLLDKAASRGKPMILGFTEDEGIVKFAEESSWKVVEANLESFIPTSVASSLTKRHKAVLVRRIRSRYFGDSTTDSKVLDIMRILQDHMMMVPVLQVARKLANSSYGYVFDFVGPWTPDPTYISQFHVSGVNHGFDLRYLLYNPDDPQDLGNCSSLRDSLRVRDRMVNWWTSFVKTGSPGSDWPKISTGGYLRIHTNATMINATTVENEHNFDFWTTLDKVADDTPDSSASLTRLNFLMVFITLYSILVTV